MYMDVYSKVIQNGLTIVNRLALVNTDPKLSNDAFFDRQCKTLSEYNTTAEATVNEIVRAVRLPYSSPLAVITTVH